MSSERRQKEAKKTSMQKGCWFHLKPVAADTQTPKTSRTHIDIALARSPSGWAAHLQQGPSSVKCASPRQKFYQLQAKYHCHISNTSPTASLHKIRLAIDETKRAKGRCQRLWLPIYQHQQLKWLSRPSTSTGPPTHNTLGAQHKPAFRLAIALQWAHKTNTRALVSQADCKLDGGLKPRRDDR